MAYRKNRKDFLDKEISVSNQINEWYDWDYEYYEFDDGCTCAMCRPRDCHEYEYDDTFYHPGLRKIDLDSISPDRKRNSIIESIIGDVDINRNTIGNIINGSKIQL